MSSDLFREYSKFLKGKAQSSKGPLEYERPGKFQVAERRQGPTRTAVGLINIRWQTARKLGEDQSLNTPRSHPGHVPIQLRPS